MERIFLFYYEESKLYIVINIGHIICVYFLKSKHLHYQMWVQVVIWLRHDRHYTNTFCGISAGWPGFSSRQGQWWDIFLLTTASRPALGSTQPLVQCVLGAVAPGVKRPKR